MQPKKYQAPIHKNQQPPPMVYLTNLQNLTTTLNHP